MERLITNDIIEWYNHGDETCLLVDGARQVGKTYIIEDFCKKHCKSYVEIDLMQDERARNLLSHLKNADEMILFLNVLYPGRLVERETVIFIDEVQECLELLTAVKYLVRDGRYRYILSGSLLGVVMSKVRSMPVGYMEMLHMYPMNFREFLGALGMEQAPVNYLKDCFENVKPINPEIHDSVMHLYRLYLLIGGMPAAVQAYLDTKDLVRVGKIHENICNVYREDITKYDVSNKLLISEIFDLIPSELNCQNKRFNYASTSAGRMTVTLNKSVLWLTRAGVAIPVYCADEPKYPLIMSKSRNLLKLFLCDMGLLSYMYFNDDVQVKILADDTDVNFGAIYENAVAQELKSNGLTPFYYSSHRLGELDLLAEINDEVIPIEVKSGKNYQKHSALNKIIDIVDYHIERAYVFSTFGDIKKTEKRIYMPIYMSMFLKREKKDSNIVDVGVPFWDTP